MDMRVDPIPEMSSTDTYRDAKRYVWLIYPLWMLTPIVGVALGLQTGNAAWFWLTPVLLFIVMPILDLVLGINTKNAPEESEERLDSDPYYRYVVRFTVVLHFVALFLGAWAVGTHAFGWLDYTAVALSCGLISAWGIVTAHELGHKKGALDRWLSKIVLATGAYGCYMTDHNAGHHRDIATPEDSGSSRFGENLYYFLVMRQVPHSAFVRPWQLEKARLARSGKGPWSLENQVVYSALVTLLLYGGLIAVFGVTVVPYLFVVAFISFFFLGFIDYIEHYGLLRQKRPDGRYERVRPGHSWNTDHVATNVIYLHAQRHSDHHAYPTRRYQVLRHFPNLPTMPTGYPGMYWLCIFPPLWRAVMDPILLKLHDHDLNRINIDPAKRDALFAKYSRVPDKSKVPAPIGHDEACAPTSAAHVSVASKSYQCPCPGCGYTYREAVGDPAQGFPAGTPWSRIPASWSCPDCAVRDKVDFVELSPDRVAVP
ncbi:MAG: alkB [Panacagrimonas sp.]|jgi:alkane 1-monooxygenase|nr:fatty acid desaturase [Panacagrimonas sp.]MCC2657580.1 alkB [Panacagrimonas sp.]